MNCDNSFCIYWQDNRCLLEEISLDRLGQCMDCIYVEIKEEELAEHRKEGRSRLPKGE